MVSLLAIALLAWFLQRREPRRRVDAGAAARASTCCCWRSLLVAATFWVRAVRWQYLLAPIGPTRFRTAFRTTVIGFAALALLPARAGDVLRPYLLARQEGLSPPATFATIVMERVLDLIAVLVAAGGLRLGLRRRVDAAAAPAARRSRCRRRSPALAAVALMGMMWVLATHPGADRRARATARVACCRSGWRARLAQLAQHVQRRASPWRASRAALVLALALVVSAVAGDCRARPGS